MKKNTLQKVLATAMVGAMAMGTLTGCGNDQGSTPVSDTPASTSQESSTQAEGGETKTEAVPGIEGYTAFADQVTLTIPVYDRGKEGVPAIGAGGAAWAGGRRAGGRRPPRAGGRRRGPRPPPPPP